MARQRALSRQAISRRGLGVGLLVYGKEVSGYQFYDRTNEAEGIAIRSEEINRIIEVSENIPYYLQAIAGLGGISTVHSALRGLLERGHVESVKRTYAIGDPFFARYIREMSASRCY